MVRRDQGPRHGSTESSGADTIKDGIGGNTYNGDSFMSPMRDRSVHLFLSKLLYPTQCIRCVPTSMSKSLCSQTEQGKSPSLSFGIGTFEECASATFFIDRRLRPVLEDER